MFKYPHEVYNTRSAQIIVPLILELFSVKSVLDVGCGLGTWLKAFQDCGVNDIVGVDGVHVENDSLLINRNHFVSYDLAKPFSFARRFDLVISLEVAEHLPIAVADQFVKCLCDASDIIIFSAAIPGQGGCMHLNEQWPSFWEQKFNLNNYLRYDVIRPVIWDDNTIDIWYRQNMFVYLKNNLLLKGNLEGVSAVIHPEYWLQKLSQFELLASRYDSILSGRIPILHAVKILIRTLMRKVERERDI